MADVAAEPLVAPHPGDVGVPCEGREAPVVVVERAGGAQPFIRGVGRGRLTAILRGGNDRG